MSPRPIRHRLWGRAMGQLGIGVVAVSLALMAVGSAIAHTGAPGTVNIAPSGLSVSASGTWTWGSQASATKLSYVGFAIDWGDLSSGNDVGPYHIGDGTPATNIVMQPTTPAQGTSGTWGPVTHAYAQAGTYTVCVIIYDLGTSKPFLASGYHGLTAAGVSRNTDNSVDKGNPVPALCGQVSIVGPSPSATVAPSTSASASGTTAATAEPSSSVLGVTSPPTSTGSPAVPDPGLPPLLLGLLFASAASSMLVFKTVRVRR
jgi:hypothetical protein